MCTTASLPAEGRMQWRSQDKLSARTQHKSTRLLLKISGRGISGSVVSSIAGSRAETEYELVRFSLTEHLWSNENVASTRELFLPSSAFIPAVIFNQRIGTFILATVATLY